MLNRVNIKSTAATSGAGGGVGGSFLLRKQQQRNNNNYNKFGRRTGNLKRKVKFIIYLMVFGPI